MKNYDIIVIGFGKAGKTLAVKAANLGKKVAVIEKSAQMYGGTCINVGCIPTKKLVNLSKEAQYVNNNVAGEYFTLSVEKKDKLISALRAKNFAMLDGNANIDVINGAAKFIDKNSIEVAAADGSKSVLTAPTIVINTGSVNEKPSFEVSSNFAYDSTGILNLKTLPKHLVVVGGGYIGLEFASMFAEFGSKVTVVARSGILKNEDDDVKQSVKTLLQTQGVEILEGCEVKNLKDCALIFTQNGETKCLEADAFLLATGRVAASRELNLSAAGVQTDTKGNVLVNEFLQTAQPHIYAVGDVRGGELFTYTSLDDFRIVFDKLFGAGKRSTLNRSPHASTLFTETPLASIGLNEKRATAQNLDFKVLKLPLAAVPGAKVVGNETGFLKAIVEAKSGKILGAAFHCVYANELINEIAIAMALGAGADFFKNQIFTHPSISEALNDLFGQF